MNVTENERLLVTNIDIVKKRRLYGMSSILVSNEFAQINMSDRYGSFDTYIAILYDILCHMVYVIKRHKMAFYANL